MLLLCEQRLDNVVRRIGLTKTRPQARQGIAHGHFRVNGSKVDKPSFMLRPGDVITVRGKDNLLKMYHGIREQGVEGEGIEWVSFDTDTLTATVNGAPSGSDISLPVDANTVVEFLSR